MTRHASSIRIFLLLFVISLALSSCADIQKDSLRFGLSSMPVTLDPRFATDAASTRINRLLYRRLVDFDESAMPVADLSVWQKLAPTHYRFVLGKDGRQFSDGTHLDATDVKATYEYVLNAANASPHRISLSHIEKIEVIDADTIDFYLTHADPLFPGRLIIGIVPKHLIETDHPFNRQPVGSGPFKLHSWPDSTRLILTRLVDNQNVEFIHVQDPTVRVLKLMRGEIDMMQNDLPPELVSYLMKQPDVRVQKGSGSNFVYLGFNMNDTTVGQLKVRLAIAHALKRKEIIKYVLGGAAHTATAILPPDHWAGDPDIVPYSYDPELSRKLLQEAGYDRGHPPHIIYKTSSDPFRLRLATIIQQQLAEVGIDVELRSFDWGTFYGDIKTGNFQMYSLMWVGVKIPDIFHYVFHSSAVPPQGANRGHFVSKLADQLIEKAEASDDLREQSRDYRELQEYLHQQLPYVPLWYEDHVFIARSDIVGYNIARDGNYDGLITVRRQ